MGMDLVLEGLLREHLMVAPLLVLVGITEQLITMGAEDFKVSAVTKSRVQRYIFFLVLQPLYFISNPLHLISALVLVFFYRNRRYATE